MLPKEYAWLDREPGPAMLRAGLALYGTHEVAGAGDNPSIMGWAKEVGARGYVHDAIAWCGLFTALCAKRGGWEFNPGGNMLWALNWAKWGNPSPEPAFGDVLVFRRKLPDGSTAGHVGQYVGEDAVAFHVLGGNQSDDVKIARVPRERLVAARRAPWKYKQPASVRPIRLAVLGGLSVNEA